MFFKPYELYDPSVRSTSSLQGHLDYWSAQSTESQVTTFSVPRTGHLWHLTDSQDGRVIFSEDTPR